MSPRTSDHKRHPVRTSRVESGPSEREKLEAVYTYVLRNWAVGNADIERGTGFEPKEVKRLAMKLARSGLLAGEHVNSERTITWQTWHDIENDSEAFEKGMKEFNEKYPEKEPVKEPVRTSHEGGSGPRYTDNQIRAAIGLRVEQNASWKEVAQQVGVKSPFHFSKVVRKNWDRLYKSAGVQKETKQ